MLLADTLGGVTPHQVLAVYCGLLAYMALLANLSLVWSTYCERGGSAAGLTALGLGFYALLPLAPLVSNELKAVGVSANTYWGAIAMTSLDWAGQSSVFQRLDLIMQTGFREPMISCQVLTNMAAAVICFVVAWAIFRPATSRSGLGASRGLVLRQRSRLGIFSAGRAWALPLAWKDFQFIAGGINLLIIKVIGGVLLLAGMLTFDAMWGGKHGIRWEFVGAEYSRIVACVIAIEACILASRIFFDEIRLQTLSSLMLLPRSIPYVAYSKVLGCLLGLAPSVACLALGLLLIPDLTVEFVLQLLMDPFHWGLVMVLAIFLHLIALLSLFVKWGALPLAIVVMAPIATCCPVTQLVFFVAGRGAVRDPFAAVTATVTVWILMGLVCFVFQMMIAARLQEIGSK
jgi:hypothetical protein